MLGRETLVRGFRSLRAVNIFTRHSKFNGNYCQALRKGPSAEQFEICFRKHTWLRLRFREHLALNSTFSPEDQLILFNPQTMLPVFVPVSTFTFTCSHHYPWSSLRTAEPYRSSCLSLRQFKWHLFFNLLRIIKYQTFFLNYLYNFLFKLPF